MHIAHNSSESIAARFLTSPFAALACVFAAVAADAKEPREEFKPIITIAQTNLRKGPRTDSEILTLIPKGTAVVVGDCRNGWCRVSWNGQDGYAVGRNLGIAAAPWWPNALLAAEAGGPHGSSQKTAKTARKHRKEDDHEEEKNRSVTKVILSIASSWRLARPGNGLSMASVRILRARLQGSLNL